MQVTSEQSAVVTSSIVSTESFGYQLLPKNQSVKVWHEELLASNFPNLPLSCKSAFDLETQVMSELVLVLLMSTVRLPQDTPHTAPAKATRYLLLANSSPTFALTEGTVSVPGYFELILLILCREEVLEVFSPTVEL